jgi:hypothetical protein
MKIVRKLIGTLLILSLVGLVIWIPADLTGTMQQMGQRSPDGNSLISAASNQTSPGLDHWVSEPVLPVFTLAARDLPPSEVLPTLDREINPRMNFGPVPDADFDPPSRPDPLLALQASAPSPGARHRLSAPRSSTSTGRATPFSTRPTPTGAVGKDHYIQMINATRVAIYDKITGSW